MNLTLAALCTSFLFWPSICDMKNGMAFISRLILLEVY